MKKNKIIFFVIATLSLIIASFGALRWSQQKRDSKRLLRVGMMSGWPPFMSIDRDGKYVGFDVDLARLVGEQLGYEIDIIDGGSLSTLFLSLETGKIDLIFSGLDITQERCNRMNMVPYTGTETIFLCALFNKQIPPEINSFANLAQQSGAIVCYEANSASEELLKFYPQIPKKQLKSVAEMVLDIRTKKSTALLVEPQVARRLLKQDPELKCLTVPLPETLKIYGCGIAIKKTNNILTEMVTQAVEKLRSDGTIERLENTWNLKGDA